MNWTGHTVNFDGEGFGSRIWNQIGGGYEESPHQSSGLVLLVQMTAQEGNQSGLGTIGNQKTIGDRPRLFKMSI